MRPIQQHVKFPQSAEIFIWKLLLQLGKKRSLGLVGAFSCLSGSKRIKSWLKCLNVRKRKYDLQVETRPGRKRKKRTTPKDEVLSLQARLPLLISHDLVWEWAHTKKPLSDNQLKFNFLHLSVPESFSCRQANPQFCWWFQHLLEWLSQNRGEGPRLSTLCSWIK